MKLKSDFTLKAVTVEHKDIEVKFDGLDGHYELELELKEMVEDNATVLKVMASLPKMVREVGEALIDIKHKDRLNGQSLWKAEDDRDERLRKAEEEREERRHKREMDLEFEKRQTALQEQKLQEHRAQKL